MKLLWRLNYNQGYRNFNQLIEIELIRFEKKQELRDLKGIEQNDEEDNSKNRIMFNNASVNPKEHWLLKSILCIMFASFFFIRPFLVAFRAYTQNSLDLQKKSTWGGVVTPPPLLYSVKGIELHFPIKEL